MKLILVRHGDAGAYTTPDSERNLSPLGNDQAKLTAKWLADFKIDKVITSPYNRAMQTAEVLTDGKLPLTICEHITPDDDARIGLKAIGALIDDEIIDNNGTVLVVCHMNIIAKMAGLLTDSTPESYFLAEGRWFELPFVALGAGDERGRFVPVLGDMS